MDSKREQEMIETENQIVAGISDMMNIARMREYVQEAINLHDVILGLAEEGDKRSKILFGDLITYVRGSQDGDDLKQLHISFRTWKIHQQSKTYGGHL